MRHVVTDQLGADAAEVAWLLHVQVEVEGSVVVPLVSTAAVQKVPGYIISLFLIYYIFPLIYVIIFFREMYVHSISLVLIIYFSKIFFISLFLSIHKKKKHVENILK